MLALVCCVLASTLGPVFGDLSGGATNIALNKPAFSSTAYYYSITNFTGLPSLAVDGDTDPNYLNMHCFSSAHDDLTPYWYVDLGANYEVDCVRIYNRQDCCADRLRNLVIEVFETNPGDGSNTGTAQACGTVTGGVAAGGSITVTCPAGVIGRYLRITKSPLLSSTDTLQFCEVEVAGTKKCPRGFKQIDNLCLLWSCFAASYAEAQMYCNILHTNLAEIETTAVNDFVVANTPSCSENRKYWIGANRLQDKETWNYFHGTVPHTPFTAPLVPSSGVILNPTMTDKCGLLSCDVSNNYVWDKGTCGTDQYFICCGTLNNFHVGSGS